MATLSHSRSATSSTWVEKNTAPPLSHNSRIIRLSVKEALGSSPVKGSSITSSRGSCSRAPTTASFCFIPWE